MSKSPKEFLWGKKFSQPDLKTLGKGILKTPSIAKRYRQNLYKDLGLANPAGTQRHLWPVLPSMRLFRFALH